MIPSIPKKRVRSTSRSKNPKWWFNQETPEVDTTPVTTVQRVTCPNCDGMADDYGDQIFCQECGYIQHKT